MTGNVSVSVAMQKGVAQCPFCERWVRLQLDRYGTATPFERCDHFVESWEHDNWRYATFAQGKS